MTIPGEHEWRNEHGDLDIAVARKNFFGISHEDAIKLFEDNALKYQEDVVFMPFACFTYYIHAYLDYLLPAASKTDADGAYCFFVVMECRAADIQKLPPETVAKIGRVLDRLATGQAYFDADETIYGSFSDRVAFIRGRLKF